MIDTSLGPDPGEQEEQLHIRDESPVSSSPLDGELGSMEFHDQEGMHTDPLSDLSASWEAARLFREDAIFAVEGIFEGLKTGNNNRSSTVPTDRQAPIRPGIKSRCHSC